MSTWLFLSTLNVPRNIRKGTAKLSANDINKANESIVKALEVKGRGKYNTYMPGQRACSSSPTSGVQVSWYTW